ncbi:ketosteroid isomerase-like protein [Tamaricihabitans halophyticus]|uniref:Ketosteroid isomerase-like protein n=1 Tax=Tamaricihabitans halophyticus TaxID=1262583 RepID=A0A4R2RAJ3_9PSEU|nr:nuclear transport factor 2 family protein [Tamaricihabitans halophyticus]TCP56435.1 ketosteroid isomerase-like protein [Tamaricihabitans halophyticus]
MTRQRVEEYFAACTRGDPAAVRAQFQPDAVVYDLNHAPVWGAEAIGEFYARVWARWDGASWEVNTFVAQEDVAAAEWTMRGVSSGTPFVVRGSEHYEFQDGLISQIRQYWHYDRIDPGIGLRDYPYATDERFAP